MSNNEPIVFTHNKGPCKGKQYSYYKDKPNNRSRQCPKCNLWCGNSVKVCKCGYVFQKGKTRKRKTTRPTQPVTPAKSRPGPVGTQEIGTVGTQEIGTPTKWQAESVGTQEIETQEWDHKQISKVINVIASALFLSDADDPGQSSSDIEEALLCPDLGKRTLRKILQVLTET